MFFLSELLKQTSVLKFTLSELNFSLVFPYENCFSLHRQWLSFFFTLAVGTIL